jgi:hypothetical protein
MWSSTGQHHDNGRCLAVLGMSTLVDSGAKRDASGAGASRPPHPPRPRGEHAEQLISQREARPHHVCCQTLHNFVRPVAEEGGHAVVEGVRQPEDLPVLLRSFLPSLSGATVKPVVRL